MKTNKKLKTYCARNWGIFPCKRNSKEPATAHGFKDAAKDPEQHRKWWGNDKDLNVAVRTGKISRIFVLDIDVKEDRDGIAWIDEQQAVNGSIPDTLTTQTPSGGLHYYFRYPECMDIGCSNGTIAPGVDIKGDGGYVLVPPSKLENGLYDWIDEDAEIAAAPTWLLDEIHESKPRSSETSMKAETGLLGFDQGQRNDGIFRYGISLRNRGLAYEEAHKLVREAAANCTPPLDIEETLRCLKSAYGYDMDLPRRPFTEVGNAERLVDRFGATIRYVPEYGSWIYWNGVHWKLAELGEITQLAVIVVRDIPKECDCDEDSENYRKFSKRSETRAQIDKMISLAADHTGMSIHADQLDVNDDLFGVGNGVIDLRTGRFRQATPEDFITKQGLVEYDGSAKCPKWEKFINDIVNGDEELEKFLQRLVGYTLWGGNPEQAFFIFYGNGANGKSTFLRIIQKLLGAYAKAAESMLFVESGWSNPGGAREDIVRLKGVRLVLTTEISDRKYLNEDLVKRMTGDDTLAGRVPYGKRTIEFHPKFTPIMATNHRPIVRDDDEGIWRRINEVPFMRTFAKEEQDPKLREKLEKELPGILNWSIEGCLEYQKLGLQTPPAVVNASKSYRQDMDIFGDFIEEICEEGTDKKAIFNDLYDQYCEYAQVSHFRAMSKKAFGRKLKDRGYKPIKFKGLRGYSGIALNEPFCPSYRSKV